MSHRFDHPPGLLALSTLVRDCSVAGVPRRVMLLRLDLLPSRLSRPHHLALAVDALEPLLGADRARRFDLAHNRIAVAWRGEAADRLQMVLETLEQLLLASPMDAPAMPEMARLFDLPLDGAALLAVAAAPGAADDTTAIPAPPPLPPPPRPPLDPKQIEAMEERLATANVARFARRRLICRMGAGSLTPAWEKRYLNIEELMEALAPGRNAFADPWLFRRLTRTLDRRMLALLSSAAELRNAGPFSLDLNVSGVLSAEFLKFDTALPPALRGHTVIDLHPADIMGDLAAFRFARAFVRTRGYRVLLRGVEPTILPALDLAALDLDFVELRWSPVLNGLDATSLRAGTARWVLARADEPAAVRWGMASGIGLFQGDAVAPGPWVDPEAPVRTAA